MKKAEKFEVGKAIAEQSNGLIELTVEDGIAVLRGEFTRAERKPLRFKRGAGWRYKVEDGVETWRLNVKSLFAEPSSEKKPEPSGAVPAGAIYVKWGEGKPESFKVARSTEKSVWLVGADGSEFRKAIGESAERLSGEFYLVG